MPGTLFNDLSREFDFYADNPVTIATVLIPRERVFKEIFYIPALILVALVFFLQLRRKRLVNPLAEAAP